MPLHIGIVGCSAEGAALCYKTICSESSEILGEHVHPEITMHTPSLAKYVDCLDANDIEGVGDLMLQSAHILKNAGADFLICPDNTIHQAFEYVQERSPLPWLHIAEVVAEEAKQRGFKKVGITGTSWLVQSDVYPDALEKFGLKFTRPSEQQIARIGEIIMSELVLGKFQKESVEYFLSVIEYLKSEGCDAVALGCTEIPLIINNQNSALPTLDSTRLLARAAIRAAIKKQS